MFLKRKALLEKWMDARALKDIAVMKTAPPGRRLFNQFSILDPGWVACKVAEGITKLRQPHQFNKTPATAVQMRNDARLILVGDWGSGLPRARAVARHAPQRSGQRVHVIVQHHGLSR